MRKQTVKGSNPVAFKRLKNKIKNQVIEATAAIKFKLPSKKKVSKKVEELQKIIGADFGCYKGAVRKLVGKVIGEVIPDPDSQYKPKPYKRFQAVVPTCVTSGYSGRKKVAVIFEDGNPHAVKRYGVIGSSLPPFNKTRIRPATPKEIGEYFDELPDKGYDLIINGAK